MSQEHVKLHAVWSGLLAFIDNSFVNWQKSRGSLKLSRLAAVVRTISW